MTTRTKKTATPAAAKTAPVAPKANENASASEPATPIKKTRGPRKSDNIAPEKLIAAYMTTHRMNPNATYEDVSALIQKRLKLHVEATTISMRVSGWRRRWEKNNKDGVNLPKLGGVKRGGGKGRGKSDWASLASIIDGGDFDALLADDNESDDKGNKGDS